jgi:Xaa-Pro dipeptidase
MAPTPDERTLRVAEAARSVGADWTLLASPELVFYASGFDAPVELGPSPHAGGPNAAIVSSEGEVRLVVEDLQEEAALTSRAVDVVAVRGFAPHAHPRPLHTEYRRAVMQAVGELDLGSKVAVESGVLPEGIATALRDDGFIVVDATEEFRRARATKTADELDCLRACAELTAVGQRAVVEAARPGVSELELFAQVRLSMEVAAGTPLSIGVDLLSGAERTVQVMGWPSRRRVATGDPVLCDLTPRFGGYWGDSCNTFVVDAEATEAFADLRLAVTRALERAAEVIKPGIGAGQLDHAVRSVIEKHGLTDPLHIGHGIGTANSEYPRIVPGEPATLEAGMVLMIEPCAYLEGVGGVRLEWMFVVTETGSELLSPYEHAASTLELIA